MADSDRPTAVRPRTTLRTVLNSVFGRFHFGLGTILIIVVILLALFIPRFGRLSNFVNIISQSTVLAIMALGQTFVIILGGIDLSVGAVGALVGALATGLIVNNGLSPYLAVALALLVGLVIGIINGTLVQTFRVPPFVATLSMLAIARGLTLVYTNGAPISTDNPVFIGIAAPGFAGISYAILLMLLLYVGAYFVLKFTPYGLHIYATGYNSRFAHLSGVPTGRITFSVYALCSLCASLGGVVLASRLWSAQPTAAVGMELEAIAVTVLGGASLFGGIGNVQGTLVGTLLLGVFSNGMNLMSTPAYVQRVIRGAILVAAVGIDVQARRRRSAAKKR